RRRHTSCYRDWSSDVCASDLEPRGPDPARLEAYRRACHSDKQAFWTMLRTERLTLATDRLVYFAHWITPEESPLRFDTRFFAAEIGRAAWRDRRHVAVVSRW